MAYILCKLGNYKRQQTEAQLQLTLPFTIGTPLSSTAILKISAPWHTEETSFPADIEEMSDVYEETHLNLLRPQCLNLNDPYEQRRCVEANNSNQE